KGGPGNPFGRRLAAMREAVQRAVTVEAIEQLMGVLLGKAMAGDLGAAKLVLQYAVGKPKPVVEPDRMDAEEWEVTQESWVPAAACTELLAGVPVGAANVMVDAVAETRTEQLALALRDPAAAAGMFAEVDDDDRPLTPEEIAEAKREWVEAKERVAAMMAGAAPSFTGANGESDAAPAVKHRDKRGTAAAADAKGSAFQGEHAQAEPSAR
ncbi:MAG: hypothetical protein WCL32_17530, partial [Planctomycetota bacterium]